MAVRKPNISENGVYFCTFTCCHWLPLFEKTNAYDLVYKWFNYLQKHHHNIVGYIIMPNHLHLLINYHFDGKSLNTIIGNGKRFLAYDIVQRLTEQKETEILKKLSEKVNPSDRKRGKIHHVFEDSFEMKICKSQEFLLQKLNYIHNNPCSGKWQLAKDTISYPHSSASFYDTGVQGVYSITSWMEINGND